MDKLSLASLYEENKDKYPRILESDDPTPTSCALNGSPSIPESEEGREIINSVLKAHLGTPTNDENSDYDYIANVPEWIIDLMDKIDFEKGEYPDFGSNLMWRVAIMVDDLWEKTGTDQTTLASLVHKTFVFQKMLTKTIEVLRKYVEVIGAFEEREDRDAIMKEASITKYAEILTSNHPAAMKVSSEIRAELLESAKQREAIKRIASMIGGSGEA